MKNNSTKDNRVIDFKNASGRLKAKHRAQALAAMSRFQLLSLGKRDFFKADTA